MTPNSRSSCLNFPSAGISEYTTIPSSILLTPNPFYCLFRHKISFWKYHWNKQTLFMYQNLNFCQTSGRALSSCVWGNKVTLNATHKPVNKGLKSPWEMCGQRRKGSHLLHTSLGDSEPNWNVSVPAARWGMRPKDNHHSPQGLGEI